MINFNGIDILFGRPVPGADLCRTVAKVLGVASSRVVSISDLADYPAPQAADVVCVSNPIQGDFAQLTSIQSDARQLPYDSVFTLVQTIADKLSVHCIVPDDDPSPYSMVLLEPGQPPRRVSLNAESMDADRYVLLD